MTIYTLNHIDLTLLFVVILCKGHEATESTPCIIPVLDTTSMTTFFNSIDLMTHVFGFITQKEDTRNVCLVNKEWKELSHTFPEWTMAVLNATDEDGSGLDHEVDRWEVPPRNASLSAVKEMMSASSSHEVV